jgi:cobyrinic acid a,c-diamide synthase
MANSMPIPRVVIAAPQGRSGKTTVSMGLCAAFSARGLAVQPFKKGPDYIDPSWLSASSGRACRSLDPFFHVTSQALCQAFVKGARGADLCLLEGNHGLFDDSLEESYGEGSTAAVARALKASILLVVNAARMTRSAAAMVHGYQTFEPGTPIAGVILNNVAHGRHEARLRHAIENACGIPVVGAIPRDEQLTIPDRHLGLTPQGENEAYLPVIAACRETVERHLDLEAVLQIARTASGRLEEERPPQENRPNEIKWEDKPVIGMLRDRAFSFYYPENLEALEEVGARLVTIDSFLDARLPHVDALYIGGGFPEMFLKELVANHSLRLDIRRAIEEGLPVYAECGGLMYLSQCIRWGEQQAEMCGALPFEVEMSRRPQGHGYVMAQAQVENPIFPVGSPVRGHEFHHSKIICEQDDLPRAYRLKRGAGLGDGQDGILYRQVFAAYTHLHAAGAPDWAPGFVRQARGRLG